VAEVFSPRKKRPATDPVLTAISSVDAGLPATFWFCTSLALFSVLSTLCPLRRGLSKNPMFSMSTYDGSALNFVVRNRREGA